VFKNQLCHAALTSLLAFVTSPLTLLAQQNSPPTMDKTQALAADKDQEQPANSTEALQKATQNPVANLISVPLQNNTNLGIGLRPYTRCS